MQLTCKDLKPVAFLIVFEVPLVIGLFLLSNSSHFEVFFIREIFHLSVQCLQCNEYITS